MSREASIRTRFSPTVHGNQTGTKPNTPSFHVVCFRVINLTRKIVIVNALLMCNEFRSTLVQRIRAQVVLKRSGEPNHKFRCHQEFHLKCLGSEFESMQLCYLCAIPVDSPIFYLMTSAFTGNNWGKLQKS